MATKTDFTEQQWKTMQKGVTGAGMLVSVGDRDFTDSFGEANAMSKYLVGQREQAESELVRELCHVHGTGFGISESPQKIEAETLSALSDSIAAIGSKSPDDVDAYRQLVLGVAEAVAEAKGGVSGAEAAVMEKLKGALGSA